MNTTKMMVRKDGVKLTPKQALIQYEMINRASDEVRTRYWAEVDAINNGVRRVTVPEERIGELYDRIGNWIFDVEEAA